MTKHTYLSVFFLLFLACSPDDNNTPVTPVIDETNKPDSAILISSRMLTGQQGHTASGTASIYQDSTGYSLVFDPYSSQNGPDLKVYLSTDYTASDYIRLGPLKSTTGRQTYPIPSGVDLTKYPFVHVWCERYSVEFARAELK